MRRDFFFFFGWSDVYGLIDRPYIHEIKKKKKMHLIFKKDASTAMLCIQCISFSSMNCTNNFFFLNKTLESTNSFKHILIVFII